RGADLDHLVGVRTAHRPPAHRDRGAGQVRACVHHRPDAAVGAALPARGHPARAPAGFAAASLNAGAHDIRSGPAAGPDRPSMLRHIQEVTKVKKRTVAAVVGAMLGAVVLAAPAHAQDVKIGLMAAISGPIAALAPPMAAASKLAVAHVNEQGGILKGGKLEAVLGDSACNPQNATDAATKAVNIDRVLAIVGPACSGAVLATANSVAIPAGVLMITPSGTSPEITKLNDKDLVYRTLPSDDYQGRALARTLKARGIDKVAVAYLNNDYGKGLAESFKAEFEANGGTIAGYSGHEDGKASYRSELATLARGGADTLVLFDYGDGTGLSLLRQALENGFFKTFVGADGMKSEG